MVENKIYKLAEGIGNLKLLILTEGQKKEKDHYISDSNQSRFDGHNSQKEISIERKK